MKLPNPHARNHALAWMPCIIAVASALASTRVSAQSLDLARAEAVADSAARAQVAAGQIPGFVVAVARNGQPVFVRAYGLADVEMNAPVTTETVFRMRSVTKQFTAAAVMQLVERGKIGLDDPITKYLPDFPVQGNVVTIRNLLNHTSGLTTTSGRIDAATLLGRKGGEAQWIKLDFTYAEMVERFAKLPFEFKPGEKFDYNNLGYFMLGEIIGKVTGTPYAEYIERDVLRPLGLHKTWYCDDHRIIPGRAEGYEFIEGKLINAPYTSAVSPGGAAGSLCSTVGDMLRWTTLLHGGKVVSPASFEVMTTRPRLTGGDSSWYGMGLYLPPARVAFGHRKIYHGGTRPGFGAYVSHYPNEGLTVAIFNNGGSGREKAEEMELAITRAAFGAEAKPIAAAALARYEGTYVVNLGTRMVEARVFVENGQLRSQLTGQAVGALLYQGDHAFVSASNHENRTVFGAEQGRSETLTLHLGARQFPGTRKP